jgi:hypothetical protein
MLQSKLADSQKNDSMKEAEMQQAQGDVGRTMNPFATNKNKYFDQYASQLPANTVGAGLGHNTPHYSPEKKGQ